MIYYTHQRIGCEPENQGILVKVLEEATESETTILSEQKFT